MVSRCEIHALWEIIHESLSIPLSLQDACKFFHVFSIWPSSRYLYKSRMPGWLAPCAIFSTLSSSHQDLNSNLCSWVASVGVESQRSQSHLGFFFLGGRRLGWPGQSCMEKKGWLTSRDSVWSLSIKSTWSWKVSRFTGDLWQKASSLQLKGMIVHGKSTEAWSSETSGANCTCMTSNSNLGSSTWERIGRA